MKSSGAVPFTTIFALLVLLFGISVPLEVLQRILRCPRKSGEAPSANQQYSMSLSTTTVRNVPKFLYFVRGIVALGAVYTKFFLIMSALWQHQFYCLFSSTSDAGLRPTGRNLVG